MSDEDEFLFVCTDCGLEFPGEELYGCEECELDGMCDQCFESHDCEEGDDV